MLNRTVAATLAVALSSAVLATVAGTTLASAATPVRLLAGSTPATAPFPNDAFTVADSAQLTGKRVALPTAGCDAQGRSLCDDLALINQLDGFDLQPRVTLPFDGAVDLRSVTPTSVYVQAPGGARTGLVQLVLDPGSNTVSGSTDAFLQPRTTYSLVVTNAVKGVDGTPVDLGAGATSRRVPFTTMTSTNTLDKAREQLDAGTAYTDAAIAADQRGIAFDAVEGMPRSVFAGPTVVNVARQDQTSADPAASKTTQNAIVAAKSAAFLGFGSIRSPQYVDGEGVIAQVPTTRAPRPRGAAQIGVTMMTGEPSPTSCLQPVVFGPGFSRSKFDLFLSGDLMPGRGTAVFATDPLGHNYGPTSTFSVQTQTGTTTGGKAFGRGKDLDGDGVIGNTEGVGPTYKVSRTATGGFTPTEPSPRTAIGLRDGLIQTVIDNMALVRAIAKGVDVNGDGTVDTCVGAGNEVSYYGQSFGGIYGTMLLGTDPTVKVGVPNVPGGPIIDIARTSGFRGNIAAVLQANKPNLLNGGPGLNGFTESLPLRLDPRIDKPFPGSKPIRDLFGRGNWVARPGSPETYASRLGKGGVFADKKVIFQIAYTDGTVPNPTSGTLLRAGDLYDKAWVYRNDRTPTVQTNPHGFLLDPTLAGRNQGQQQIQDWITSKGMTETDPDAAGNVWEKDPERYRVQLDCLHYPDPQTGLAQTRTPNSPDCTDQSATVAPGPAPGVSGSPAPSPTPSASSGGGLPLPGPGGGSPSASPGPATPTVTVDPSTITSQESATVVVNGSPGTRIELQAYSRPSTTYVKVREATMPESGRIEFRVGPSGNTRLFARSVDSGGRSADSTSTVLTVRTSINLKVARTATRTYRFTGSTLPKRRGQLVTIFYESGGDRTIASRARVAQDGTYNVTRTFTGTGTFVLFTGTGTDINNAAGTSNRVRTTIR